MIVVLDENLPLRLAQALAILGKDAKHATEIVPKGTPDDQLVRAVADLGGCIFSHDGQMLHNVATVAALERHQIRLVVFHDAQLSCFELARLMIWAWPEVHRQIGLGRHRFFEITARGRVREKRLRR